MIIDLTSCPVAIARLAAILADQGIALRAVAFESRHNQMMEAHTPVGSMRVVVDRGQWFVELASPGHAEYFDTAVWEACLRGGPVSLELIPLDEQVSWFEAALRSEDTRRCSLECLLGARQRRAYGRMGIAF